MQKEMRSAMNKEEYDEIVARLKDALMNATLDADAEYVDGVEYFRKRQAERQAAGNADPSSTLQNV